METSSIGGFPSSIPSVARECKRPTLLTFTLGFCLSCREAHLQATPCWSLVVCFDFKTYIAWSLINSWGCLNVQNRKKFKKASFSHYVLFQQTALMPSASWTLFISLLTTLCVCVSVCVCVCVCVCACENRLSGSCLSLLLQKLLSLKKKLSRPSCRSKTAILPSWDSVLMAGFWSHTTATPLLVPCLDTFWMYIALALQYHPFPTANDTRT